MTKHDEVRQILHDTGFGFKDGRTALDMTDEEVDKWLVAFVATMADVARDLATSFKTLTTSLIGVVERLQNLGHLLEEAETSRDIHGV